MKKEDLVLAFLRKEDKENPGKEWTTSEISERLAMRRTNTSALLNELVRKGVVEKGEHRPVLYRLRRSGTVFGPAFSALAGSKHILKPALDCILSTLEFPASFLPHFLIEGKEGSGKSELARKIYETMIEMKKIDKRAPFFKLNLKYFESRIHELESIIQASGFSEKIKNGVLCLENVQLLPFRYRYLVYDLITAARNGIPSFTLICTVETTPDPDLRGLELIDCRVEMPDWNQWNLVDRFEGISALLKKESRKLQKRIWIEGAIIQNICMLDDKEIQIKTIGKMIHEAVKKANRSRKSDHECFLSLEDFPEEVGGQEGKRINRRHELESLVSSIEMYCVSQETIEKTPVLKTKREVICSEEELETLAVAYLEKGTYPETRESWNRMIESIAKANSWVIAPAQENALLWLLDDFHSKRIRFISPDLKDVSLDHIVLRFIKVLQEQTRKEPKAVLLLAVQKEIGQGIAVYLTNHFPNTDVSALPMENVQDSEALYSAIYESLSSVPETLEIIALYDLDRVKRMIGHAARILNRKIAFFYMPVVAVCDDLAIKIQSGKSVDEIRDTMHKDYESYFPYLVSHSDRSASKAIIAFCENGMGGSIQVCRYLEESGEFPDVRFFPLSISDPNTLYYEVDRLGKQYAILGIVGMKDPHLRGVVYVSLEKVFGISKKKLPLLFGNKGELVKLEQGFSYAKLFKNMERCVTFDLEIVKNDLVNVMETINKIYNLGRNRKYGLLMHLCGVIEIKIKERSSQNHTNRAGKEKNVFLAEELKPIERKLGICFDRTDIETMLLIIEKKKSV